MNGPCNELTLERIVFAMNPPCNEWYFQSVLLQ
jgi:hypothetical protein